MDSCPVCSSDLDSKTAVFCSGSCGSIFHHSCVGMTKSHHSSWSAKVGLLWFCNSCRLNFDPTIYEREKIIMKALRELLIRTDSMDTRLGNYGENLRKINKTLYGSNLSKSTNSSVITRSIDQMILDDSSDDVLNRSRSCDETSFFEVLDEVNSSIAQPLEKFVVGNKRVQILENPSTIPVNSTCPRIDDSTPAVSSNYSNRPSTSGSIVDPSGKHTNKKTRSNNHTLKVASRDQSSNDVESYYVTPFAPDQSEEEVEAFIADITNAHPALIKVTKLVPRGKNLTDLSFVSFKITICKSYSKVVSDAWYWPEGITVRLFEATPKNDAAVRLQNSK